MRVATRRQRAAWRVFGGSFRAGRTKRYPQRPARDRGSARRGPRPRRPARGGRPLPGGPAGHRAAGARTAPRRLARAPRRRLGCCSIRELDSDGYRRWVDDYRDFVRTEGAGVLPVGPVQPHRVRDTAPSRIWAAYEQVRAYEPVLRWADVETLHDLRIAGKWLRYTLEFVREALGPDVGAAHRAGHRAPGPPRADARRRRRGVDGAGVPRRARRRPVAARERRDRPLPRQPRARGRPPAADHRRTVARRRRASASGGRSGASSRALTRRADRGPGRLAPASRGPARGAGRARRGRRGAAARIAPSRMPASDTRSRIRAVAAQDRIDDHGPGGQDPGADRADAVTPGGELRGLGRQQRQRPGGPLASSVPSRHRTGPP